MNSIQTQSSNNQPENNPRSYIPWIIVILIAAWLIGLSILGAGWLIAREISRQGNDSLNPLNQNLTINKPIDITIPENMPKLGNSDAKVKVIEFADFQCPFCGDWQKEIYPRLKSEFIDTGKVEFVYWDFAFLGEESLWAAEASTCAKDQDRYWEYHDALFARQDGENKGAFSQENLKQIAGDLGLNQEQFSDCFQSGRYKTRIQDLGNQAADYGVNSTPTVFINGLKFEGVMPWENYKQIIEAELAK